MSTISALGLAIEAIFSGYTPLLILAGLLIGFLFGALPGIGSVLGMAVLLPLTIYMDGINAIVLLVSIYSGGMYGGSISAILFNVPGTPAAAATTFDGYELSKKGQAVTALAISATGSTIGGSLTVIALIILTPLLTEIVLLFSSPEYFLMALFGISMITVVTDGSMVKGFIAGALGLILMTVGISPMTAETRYTYGFTMLHDGLDFVAIMIGLFALAEMIRLAPQRGTIADKGVNLTGSISEGIMEVIRRPILVLKSSFIGLVIGSVPGSGAEVSNFVSYGEAVRSSEDAESYGDGDPRGVIASEVSNNSTVAGALIPTLSFGVPGGAAAAVLLGGLIMHGLSPGQELFSTNLHIPYSIYGALLIGNLFILVFGLLVVTRAGVLTKINTHYIIPVIIVLSLTGGFALRSNWVDIFTILLIGFYGYFMKEFDFSVIAFVLGAVLGGIVETNFQRSLQISDGSWLIFVSQPISIILVALIALVVLTPIVKPLLNWGMKSSGE